MAQQAGRPKVGNKHKGHRSSAHKGYYENQFNRTIINKARRARRRQNQKQLALHKAQAKYDKNLKTCRHDGLHPRPTA